MVDSRYNIMFMKREWGILPKEPDPSTFKTWNDLNPTYYVDWSEFSIYLISSSNYCSDYSLDSSLLFYFKSV